ncbi:uncharacterized protein LOC106074906 [Biomphalaria glabrata]|uniref:Uncharacterized protein LOC106074906 n=1 Tax=Biomphalaria glabrata TaxID=6526 RepID=A0A9W3AUS0_BIOGL|nr:uncharacterized protein LOC106074906 [Biomphalaria glabrata]XP_055891025.1 uncharacterized protein LOC106074906 [Biomphalaria glabrata]XP_055891026.1 uncharacterized protein LOC106074906 [Biomphalaria glabrata]XP_055891027.1 uncharacterized protein LOC106074906 [Biomphalaria glabrata]XP_055891028.1 uncharacterized protein LOC106074906 [Biomphalaria glabrata]XP_055891029.1 uncharacterized protein LOC106074906 [Biomphalaria glabrata]XP_055891030.1 uncharacterized protein LOC106074906 [Biomph
MKLTMRPKEFLGRLYSESSLRFRLLALVLGMFLLTLLVTRYQSWCVRFPALLWLRYDICKAWEDFSFTPDFDQSHRWWQIACQLESDWETIDYECKDLRRMGNWPVCFDEPFRPPDKNKPCIVYSFGIAFDFRFDDAMAKFNCTVFSFDPSMQVKDHRRGDNVHFRKLGIGAKDNAEFKPRLDGYTKPEDHWNVRSLGSIMKMLGHTATSISLLKLDIEGNEWSVLTNLLDEGILEKLPQVLIEWHIFNDSPPHEMYPKMSEDYIRFQSLGFRKFWMRNEGRNHWIPKMVTQAEVAYINSKYIRTQSSLR